MERAKIISSRDIGEKIKFRRQDIGISQERLAEIVGVTYQQVQRYENGKNKLNVENIQVIAAALSVPVSYFFTADRPKGVGEPQVTYQTAEEQALLKDFRKIPEDAEKQLVLGVARLAAKR